MQAPLPALITLALLGAALAAPAGAHAADGTPRRPLAGDTRVVVTLQLRPRNAALLERLASAASARPPLPARLVRQLFLPTARQVERVRAEMIRAGLRPLGRDGLAMRFQATASSAARVFRVSLLHGRTRDGERAVVPSGKPRPPSSIARLVQDVEGLDTSQRPRPLLAPAPAAPVVPSCPGPARVRAYLPAELGSAGGYRHNALLRQGFDGTGERVALVEFSNYKRSDVGRFKACFGLSVPIVDRPVGPGTRDMNGSDEVALDVETTIAAAPGLDAAYVYVAPPVGTMASVLNQIVDEAAVTGVRIVSISWGLCEPALTPARVAATAAALQLAAVSGITVLAASGDSGSFDCFGFPIVAADDPASQPFATGVGGTDLRLGRPGPGHEVAWNDVFGASGGGLSRFWPRPTWQFGPGVRNRFSNGNRQVPDVALHASPAQHGYPVYCTTAVCGGAGWTTFGGTSAAAPLLAGIVAAANEYSLAHGGARLGFANPFLYRQLRTNRLVFRDVVRGSNDIGGAGRYPAAPGYDMATGAGSVNAQRLAQALAATSPAAIGIGESRITARPHGNVTIRFGQKVTFRGRLFRAGRLPVAGQRVYLQGADFLGVREWTTRTDADGRWSVTLRRQLTRKLTWRVVYLGSQRLSPSVAGGFKVFVHPPLTALADLPRRHGAYRAHAGARFKLAGRTLGALYSRPVRAEARLLSGGSWIALATDRVGVSGRYGRLVSLPEAGRWVVRWRYEGGRHGQWLSARSPERLVVVSG
jgi:subtilisin family serine protease